MDYDKLTSRLALTSFITGILGMFLFNLLIFQFVAVATGFSAVIRNDPGGLTGKWRAWIGLTLGIVYSLLGLVRLVVPAS